MESSSAVESFGAAMLMCVVLLLLASPVIYAGWKNRNRFQNLRSIESNFKNSDIGDYVLLSGQIECISQNIRSPFQSEYCCLSMWDVSTLNRTGNLGAGFYWSQEAVGIDACDISVSTDSKNVRIKNISNEKTLDADEKIKRSIMADSTSKFSSVEIQLDDSSFSEKIRPTEESKYEDFDESFSFTRPSKDSYGIIGSILSKVRTPEGTTRYREYNFKEGDKLTIIAKKTSEGLSYESSESVNPLISPDSISSITRKYRLAYLFQLYFVPSFCIIFSGLLGYGAYL